MEWKIRNKKKKTDAVSGRIKAASSKIEKKKKRIVTFNSSGMMLDPMIRVEGCKKAGEQKEWRTKKCMDEWYRRFVQTDR